MLYPQPLTTSLVFTARMWKSGCQGPSVGMLPRALTLTLQKKPLEVSLWRSHPYHKIQQVTANKVTFQEVFFQIPESRYLKLYWLHIHNTSCPVDCCAVISVMSHFAIPSTVARQASLVHGIFQAKVLKWGVLYSSRGFSWPKNGNYISCISCIDGHVLYH